MFTKKESYSIEQLPKDISSAVDDFNRRCDKNTLTAERIIRKFSVTKFKVFLGLIYLFFHCIFLQGIYVIVKKISYISTSQFSLIRYIGMFVIILPVAIYCNNRILSEKKKWFLLIVRAVLTSTGLFLQIISYRYLQLAEASIVIAISPFLTAVIARILLKERLGLIQVITLITTLCGIILSLRLPEVLRDNKDRCFDASFILGLITSIASVLCLAFSTVALRQLKEVHVTVCMLYLSLFGMAENAFLNGTFFPVVPIICGWDQISCLFVGIFGAASDCFFTLAIQVEPAGIATVQKCSIEILLSTISQILFFSVYPDVYVICGACVILISLVAIGIKNWVLTLPEDSTKRQKLKWILL